MIYNTDSQGSWFLIHTHPKQEERTISNLRAWNIETLSPLVRDWRYNQFTGERSPVIKPLFARYVFARFDLSSLFHKIRYSRGVQEVVGFGDGPVEIDQEVINIIRSRMDKNGFVTIGSDLKPGDKVLIMDGPLKQFTGVFEREIKDSDRVVLLLNTVSYQARVQVGLNHLTKLSDSACYA
jgi:transcriptional antiterminator RfaH